MRTLHAAVLATRRTPGLSSAWSAAYAAAAACCARGLAALPGVSAVVLHRGAARAPEPGVSDLDFILVREPLAARAEASWAAGLGERKRLLRRAFPMLGDLWVAEPAELERYRRFGGLRAWEDGPGWRVLTGRLPAAPAYGASALKRRWLDPWVWAFISHMELSRRLLRPGRDLPAKRDADLRKMHADCARLCGFLLDPAAAEPAARALSDDRPPAALWRDSARLLSEASRVVLAACSDGESSAEAWAPPADPAPRRRAEGLRRSLGAQAVVLDAPYHSWAVLDDAAGPDRLWAVAEALAAEPGLPGVPLALTRASWALALQSSYLGAPLGSLDGPIAAPPVDGLFAGWGPVSVGDARAGLSRLPAALRREAAAEAAAWMALWWRALWAEEDFGNRFVLYHLHGRTAALSKSPAGGAAQYDAAVERFTREEPAACVDALPRAVLAPEHAALIAAALRRLGESP